MRPSRRARCRPPTRRSSFSATRADLRETFKEERARAQELRDSYFATVRALTNAVEARDAYTGKHAERVAAYALEIGEPSGQRWADSPEIEFGFLLHDIGKVAVPDSILHKPEPLTPKERELIQQHPVTGWEIVRQVDFLERGVRCGAPPPRALGRRQVPRRAEGRQDPADRAGLRGRGHVRRSRRRALPAASPIADARTLIQEGRGSQFDPAVVDAFAAMPDDVFERIREEIG